MYDKRLTCHRNFCLSLTRVDQSKTAEDRIKQFSLLYGSPMPLVFAVGPISFKTKQQLRYFSSQLQARGSRGGAELCRWGVVEVNFGAFLPL